jgi:hypothetical protein
MSENWQSEPVKTTHRVRGFFIYVALLVLAFLLGLVPMWLASRDCTSRLANAERQLSLLRMENSLASAAIDARRGDYETARQAASDFFTVLRTETSNGVDSALSEAEIASLQPLLSRRDEIITLLARGEATSADLLSDLYASYRELVNQ